MRIMPLSKTTAFALLSALVLVACGVKAPPAPTLPKAASAPATPPATSAPTATPASPAPAPAPAKPAPAGPKTKVQIGISTMSLSFATVIVADAAGYYGDENLDVEQVVIAGAPGYAALNKGELHAYAGDSSRLYQLAENGDKNFLMVQKLLDAVTMDVTVTKAFAQKRGVTTQTPLDDRIRALKGAKWGITALGAAPQTMLSYLSRRVGLDPEKDMEFVATKTVPAYMVAAQQGQVDGFMSTAPSGIQAEAEGWGLTLIPFKDVPEFLNVPHESLQISVELAKKNPDLVKRMVRANARARSLLASDPDKATALLSKAFTNVKPDLLTASIRNLKPGFGADKGLIDAKEIEAHMAMGIKAQIIKGPFKYEQGAHWTNEFNQ